MRIDDKILKKINALIKEFEQCENDLCLEEVLMDSALSSCLEKRINQITPIKTQYENYLALIQIYNEIKKISNDKNNEFIKVKKDIKIKIEELTKMVLTLDAETEKATIEITHSSKQSKNWQQISCLVIKIIAKTINMRLPRQSEVKTAIDLT